MYYWPPKKEITNFLNVFRVLLMLIFIKEKKLERSKHWKNKIVATIPSNDMFSKGFLKV